MGLGGNCFFHRQRRPTDGKRPSKDMGRLRLSYETGAFSRSSIKSDTHLGEIPFVSEATKVKSRKVSIGRPWIFGYSYFPKQISYSTPHGATQELDVQQPAWKVGRIFLK